MAGKIDISKLAARLGELDKKNSGGEALGIKYADINDGRNQYRLLPGKEDPTDFYAEAWVHYGVGKNANNKGTFVVCPTTTNENAYCPQCALSKEMYSLSKKKDDNYSKQAKQFMRKKRVYFNVIDRSADLSSYSKNEEGKWVNAEGDIESPVYVLPTGVGVFKDILKMLIDPEYGEVILDTEAGLDLIITKTGKGQFDTEYAVSFARKETPVGFDQWEDAMNDLSGFSKPRTAEEIEAIMNGETPASETSKDTGGPKDISEEEDHPKTPKKDSKPAEEPASGGDDDMSDEIAAALARRRAGKGN